MARASAVARKRAEELDDEEAEKDGRGRKRTESMKDEDETNEQQKQKQIVRSSVVFRKSNDRSKGIR